MSAFNHISPKISSYTGGNAQIQEEKCELSELSGKINF